MKKNYERDPISANEERVITALQLSEEALEAKDEERNEIAIELAKAVKELSFHIAEKGKKNGRIGRGQ